jgi:hypothetical protein
MAGAVCILPTATLSTPCISCCFLLCQRFFTAAGLATMIHTRCTSMGPDARLVQVISAQPTYFTMPCHPMPPTHATKTHAAAMHPTTSHTPPRALSIVCLCPEHTGLYWVFSLYCKGNLALCDHLTLCAVGGRPLVVTDINNINKT